MNLRDRLTERSLRARVRRELRASPRLWAEHRRVRPGTSRRFSAAWLLYLFIALIGFGWIQNLLEGSETVWPALSVVAWWFLGVTGLLIQRILGRLYDGAAVAALCHLPLTDREIFGARWHGQSLRALLVSLLYLPVGAGIAWHGGENWATRLLLTVLPSGQYLLAFAIAMVLAAWVPRVSPVLLVTGFPLAWVLLWGGVGQPEWSTPLVRVGSWLPPFGWLNQAAYHGVAGGQSSELGLLIPLVGLLAIVPMAWRRLRDDYQLDGPSTDSPEPEPVAGVDSATAAAEPESAAPTETMEGLGASMPANGAGWLERWVHRRCWTPRERQLAEFFLGESRQWTIAFAGMIWAFPAAAAVLFLFGGSAPWMVILVTVFTAAWGLTGDSWRGFAPRSNGGMYSPVYAAYPFGFGEVARMILKANLVRVAAGAPFILGLAAVGSWRVTGDAMPGLVYAGKALALWVAALPVIVLLRFSAGTNDTQRPRLRLLLTVLPLTLICVGGGATFVLASTRGVAALGFALAAMGSTSLLVAYGRAWAGGRFDLVTRYAGDDFSATTS